MAFLVLFLGIVAVAGVVWFSIVAKQKRRQAFALMGTQLGLEYSQADPYATLSEPFSLFEKGDGRGLENVLSGSWQGLDVRCFDYWYYEETTNSKGQTSRTYYRFDCVIAPVDAACSRLVIEHENLGTRLANALTFHDIQFESEDFNKAFYVKSPDVKFANDFVDERMMDWLLKNGAGFSFEVDADQMLCFCRKIDPMELVPLLGTAKAFREQIPRVVYSLYPSAAAVARSTPATDVEAENEARWTAGHWTPDPPASGAAPPEG
ncbi:MAG: hypothetical protein ACXVEI_03505 [Actinomycetota bacterium]